MGHGPHRCMRRSARRSCSTSELARAEAGRERIAGNLQRAVDKGRLSADDRDAALRLIEPTDDMARVADADLVVEAVFEDLGVKAALWRELDGLAPPEAIFASNTSSIAIRRLAEAVGGERRSQFVGMHFLQPRAGDAARRDPFRGYVDATVAAIMSCRRLGTGIVSADRPASSSPILMPFRARRCDARAGCDRRGHRAGARRLTTRCPL